MKILFPIWETVRTIGADVLTAGAEVGITEGGVYLGTDVLFSVF